MISFKQYLLLERNIANLIYVDKNLKNFIDIERITNQNIIKWIKSNLKNFIINDLNLNSGYFEELKNWENINNIEKIPEPEWFKKAIEKGEKVYHIYHLNNYLNNYIKHVIDYFNANPNLRIERISVPEAIRQSENWTKQLTKKKLTDEDPQGIKIIKSLSNGFKWVEVISQQSLDREGKLMNHCVGSYYDQVKIWKVTIYSLRDSKNMPHCTIEAKGRSIHQIKGNSNGPIKEQFIPYVVNFINDFKIENEYDLNNLNLIMIDGKAYDINNLPNRIKGDLSLSGTKITKLPDNLHVSGYLNLSGINITKLPDNLHVGGNLYLSYTKISKLPDNLYVGRNLYLSYTKISKLPDKLYVGRNLYLYDTKINKLPDDLEVKDIIYIDKGQLKFIQDKFKNKIQII